MDNFIKNACYDRYKSYRALYSRLAFLLFFSPIIYLLFVTDNLEVIKVSLLSIKNEELIILLFPIFYLLLFYYWASTGYKLEYSYNYVFGKENNSGDKLNSWRKILVPSVAIASLFSSFERRRILTFLFGLPILFVILLIPFGFLVYAFYSVLSTIEFQSSIFKWGYLIGCIYLFLTNLFFMIYNKRKKDFEKNG